MILMTDRATTRTDLSDLVSSRRAELKLSLRAVAEGGIDPATGAQEIKPSWLHRLVNGLPVIPPQLPELRALASALRLPLRAVQNAAGAQFMGIISEVWNESGTARILVARLEEMTEEERAQLAAIAETFSRGRRPGGAA